MTGFVTRAHHSSMYAFKAELVFRAGNETRACILHVVSLSSLMSKWLAE